MKKIKTALISVSDKKNLKPLLNSLKKNNIKIISSGGTYKEIKKLKFKCLEVSEFTNSPEILEGRVKTLHPKIHAGILNKRKNKIHLKDLKKNDFENIDLVIVNFYPFAETLKSTKNHNKIIENIDVGGPTMVRSAAKKFVGIKRYAHRVIPMDETLTRVAIDVSNRPYLIWKVKLKVEKLGEMDTELFKEWFQAFSQSAGITMHVENIYGDNSHHIIESCYKALARSLREALEMDPRSKKSIPSTKGSL